MSWHYKIVVKEEEYFDEKIKQYRLVEYYTDLACWTSEPVRVAQVSVDNLIWSLEKMLEAAKAAKESPELILDETAWEKQIKQAVDEADAGEFATVEKVEEIRNKYLDNN